MRFTTNALPLDLRDIAPEAMRVERDKGMTTFTVRESDAAIVASEIHRAGYTVTAGGPRVSYSSPRAFASASAHIRRF
jgi:hypothetical protein